MDVRPLTEGTNNTGYYVGDEFVLRIHRNAIDPAYEHAVLRALTGLSFAVPADRETAVRRELNGETVLTSLSYRIPGDLTNVHPRVRSIDRAAEDRDDVARIVTDPGLRDRRARLPGDGSRARPPERGVPARVPRRPGGTSAEGGRLGE